MSRKTIRVIDLLEEANKQLRRTDQWATKELKEGVIIMIESALHATGNYQGFAFIDDNDSKTDTLGYFSRQYYTTLVVIGVTIPHLSHQTKSSGIEYMHATHNQA
tara:strand:- start:347 stop:661 length:315 start_codon:yes stop_codon:yes gene_type:complete